MAEEVRQLVKRRVRRASDPFLNRLELQDRPAHGWYRFVLSFPPHLVRQYVGRFDLGKKGRVLDPFCGTGTTLVECKKHGVASVGVEANPMAHFATKVKLDWTPEPTGLVEHAGHVAGEAIRQLKKDGVPDASDLPPLVAPDGSGANLRVLPEEAENLLLTNSISARPLHKALVLLEQIERHRDDRFYDHERLALATAAVSSFSNLAFGPEVGVGPIKEDAPVVAPWLDLVSAMCGDLRLLKGSQTASAVVHLADSRAIQQVLKPGSIDAVITSPPYPNEKDYTRTTRLESVLLGFLHCRADLRALKAGMVRSNTRGVYKADDDDRWISAHSEIQRIALQIECRRQELGKTSGFERLYARVTKLYFGGMARHLADLRTVLRPGARLAYVVGDQASYLRVMIRTGQLLAEIAQSLGYAVESIDLFRTRLATATREQLREEVVVLRWPG